MKKALLPFFLLGAFAISGCSQGPSLEKVNKHNIETNVKRFDYDGNFIKPELTIDGIDSEEQWRGSEVSKTLSFQNENTVSVDAKIYRGNEALFFFFNVSDKYLNSKGNNNGDDVSLSDSIEIYIDGNNDGGIYPNEDDYQINLGINGKTRILVGSGRYWQPWNGLCQYETKLNGTLNNNDDIDTGYCVEVMLPWSQINCRKDSVIGIAVGNVDKITTEINEKPTWGGLVFDGMLIEPQRPVNYITFNGNEFYSRGERYVPSTVEGYVFDKNSNPIEDAKVTIGDSVAYSDIDGKYVINEVYSKDSIDVLVEKHGYYDLNSVIYSSLIKYGNGVIDKNFTLNEGSGTQDEDLNLKYIGETTPKIVSEVQFPTSRLYISRTADNGLVFEVNNYQDFESREVYELYIDTRQTLDEQIALNEYSYLISFKDKQLIKFVNNPKSDVYLENIAFSKIDISFNDNGCRIFVPFNIFNINSDDLIRVAYGVFNEEAQDWSPLSRFGQEIIAEDVSTYFAIDENGNVTNGPKVADVYDPALDTHSYVDLGNFGGKTVKQITFSSIDAKIDHSQSDALYVLFTTNLNKWNDSEKIELFIDVGSSSRSKRDEYTYQLIIHCNQGALLSFINYENELVQLPTTQINVYMDNTHLQLKIPYEVIETSKSNDIGFTFGVYNLVADDWDGYAYNDTYRDPTTPSLYVRVDQNNQIK